MKHWIIKAEHALATGQPKLAELYLRRGLSEHPDGRVWLQQRDTMQALFGAGQQIVEAYAAFGRALVDAYTPIFDLVRTAEAQRQADFALAGPSKGGR